MAATIQEQVVQTFEIVKEEEIAASLEIVFETILEQMVPLELDTGEADADEARGMAGRPLVSRPGELHGAFLGSGAGHQTAVPTGDLWPAVYVDSGRLKHPVPADRGQRCDAAAVCASGDGVDRGRGPGSGGRLVRPDQANWFRSREQGGRQLAMCPMRLATMAWIAAGVTSTGGHFRACRQEAPRH